MESKQRGTQRGNETETGLSLVLLWGTESTEIFNIFGIMLDYTITWILVVLLNSMAVNKISVGSLFCLDRNEIK